ncbi:MAG: hypothetical protein F8N36_13625 [Desulfovibrio sp.]|uniref:hypothetical protein n=1 Tax=Desulfovibrio sp. TaxID=885 RepID=UPI00135E23B9|nr:hypothetical protein [Desulfovibrio sp.]MTJ93879.1 hypothetical protein [Desulfovibrio sp.]
MSQSHAFRRFNRRPRPMLVSSEVTSVPQQEKVTVLSKAYLFQWAWTLSRQAASRFGGSPSSYFSESLREAWQGFRTDPLVRQCHRLAKGGNQNTTTQAWTQQHTALMAAAVRFDDRRGQIYAKAY